jgi:hypothetical protein
LMWSHGPYCAADNLPQRSVCLHVSSPITRCLDCSIIRIYTEPHLRVPQ